MHLLHLVVNSIALLSVGVVSHPLESSNVFQPLVRRIESPDSTCGLTGVGNNLGYSCGTTTSGPCCSQFGWCGSDANYCGTGCQSAYGTCSTVTTNPGTGTGTGDGTCGPKNGGKSCSNGQCCSPSGFCGTTSEYCMSPDCLRDYGVCDSDKTPDGVTTLGSSRTLFGTVPYGADIYDCKVPGTIALTFDDGPFTYTTDLLDILKTHNAKATFFVNGVNLGKGKIDDPALPWAAMIKRMITDGHQVASHSWSHADLSTLNETDRVEEMVKNEMALRNIIGKWPTYMRPPYSSCNAACMATMRTLGYHVCYFDLDTEDYLHATPETNYISQKIVHDKLATSEDNWLSIMHDIHEQTVHNLTSYFLAQITAKGFKTVTVGECLNDPEANWYRSDEPIVSSTVTTTTTTTTPPATLTTTTTTTTVEPPPATLTTTTTTTTLEPPPATLTTATTTTTVEPPPATLTTTTTTSTTTTTTTTSTTTTTPQATKTTTTTKPATTTTTCSTTKIGSWCAKPISDFTNQSECRNAAATCTTDAQLCTTVNGVKNVKKCAKYLANTCNSLLKYCLSSKCSARSTACTKAKWQAS